MSLQGITRPGRRESAPVTNPGRHSPVSMQNRITIHRVRKGKVIDSQVQEGNIMVSYGLNRLTEMLATGGDGTTYARTLAIGTTATAPATNDTGLANSKQLCGTFNRSDQGERTVRYLGTFASNDGASTIREVGLFVTNQATASMIARATFADINRANEDEIRVSYDLIATTA